MGDGIVLAGINGANPLGFLAALGAHRVLSTSAPADSPALLRWTQSEGAWRPVLAGGGCNDEATIVQRIHAACCRKPDATIAKVRQQTGALEKQYQDAKKVLDKETRKKLAEIKGLRGEEAKAKKAEIEGSLAPLRTEATGRRKEWLDSLKNSVVFPHLRLGKNLSVTPEEFRTFAVECLEAAARGDRGWPDHTASYGCESIVREGEGGLIAPTEFCFLFGSGHQHYLETMGKLAEQVEPGHLKRALFHPWDYGDERLSMRWDPADARAYALRWAEPEGDTPMTMWGANLLACEGAAMHPTMPETHRLGTTGFSGQGAGAVFRWPIWEAPVTVDVVRSLLAFREIQKQPLDSTVLMQSGFVEVFQATKVKVGDSRNYKWSFSIAAPSE